MKPAFQFDAYIQMLRCGSDGPFMRGNKAEYALLVHCTKLNEENNRLRSSLEASVTQIMDNAREDGRTIRYWRALFWIAVGSLVVGCVYGLLSSGGVS
jgi:hypothetical protein